MTSVRPAKGDAAHLGSSWLGQLRALRDKTTEPSGALVGVKVGGDANLARIFCEVRSGDKQELVVFSRGELGEVHVLSTGELRAHGITEADVISAALRLLLDENQISDTRSVALDAPTVAVASTLDEQVASALLALARSGVDIKNPSVADAIASLKDIFRGIRDPLSRWIGRLERAVLTTDVAQVANLLDGGVAYLSPAHMTLRRRRISDQTYFEIGRESVSGAEALERRYLIDDHGDVVCEEAPRSRLELSHGPCPRQLEVGLGELDLRAVPARLHVQQYQVRLAADADLCGLERFAHVTVAGLVALHGARVVNRKELPETIALVHPTTVDIELRLMQDSANEVLAFALDDDWTAAVETIWRTLAGAEKPTVHWIAARVVDRRFRFALGPCSILYSDATGVHFRRLK